MRCTILLSLTLACAATSAQQASEQPPGPQPRNDLSAGYRYVKANDSGGGISLSGGFLESGTRLRSWLGLITQTSQTRAANLGGVAGANFTMFTLQSGPRITFAHRNFDVYGQLLLGFAHGSQPNASSIVTRAIQPGGGVDVRVNQRFALRAIDVSVLETAFADDGTGSQSHLIFSSGLVWKFNGLKPHPAALRKPAAFSEIFFTCGTETPTVVQGQSVEVLGHATTEPDEIALTFAWASTGGKIMGEGREVMLDTLGIPPGDYKVHGRAALVSSPSTYKDCAFTIRVLPTNNDIIASK